MHETVGWLQEHEKFILPILEPVSSYFSIPRLDDKPQDPILQTIHSSPARSRSLHDPPAQPPSTPAFHRAQVSLDASTQISKPALTPLWNEASLPHPQDVVSVSVVLIRGLGVIQCTRQDRSLSWGPNPPSSSQSSPFLTEQHPSVLGSLQNWSVLSNISTKTGQSKNKNR